jgi:DNA recombination protein RmuC
MLATAAVLTLLCAIGAGCAVFGVRVLQGMSQKSRLLDRRLARVEAAIVRAETNVRDARERVLEDAFSQSTRALEHSVAAIVARVELLSRHVDDVGERLNGLRLDVLREGSDLRDEVQDAQRRLEDRRSGELGELARRNGEALQALSAQLCEAGSDSVRRQETSLELIKSELAAAYASSAETLCGMVSGHVSAVSQAMGGIGRRLDEHATLLAGIDQRTTTSVQEGGRRQDALNSAVETQLAALRADAAHVLARLLQIGEQKEGTWSEFRAGLGQVSQSMAQISRAADILNDQLTVALRDPDGPIDVNALLLQFLEPQEFARDVEIEPGSQRRTEFAVKLSDNPLTQVWLPIGVLHAVDSYHQLVAASISKDAARMSSSSQAFERVVVAAAQALSARFICPPHTMNLAILFVTVDDICAEIVRRVALIDVLRRDHHVMVAGPATLPTLLIGLRAAFQGTTPAAARAGNGAVHANGAGAGLG